MLSGQAHVYFCTLGSVECASGFGKHKYSQPPLLLAHSLTPIIKDRKCLHLKLFLYEMYLFTLGMATVEMDN